MFEVFCFKMYVHTEEIVCVLQFNYQWPGQNMFSHPQRWNRANIVIHVVSFRLMCFDVISITLHVLMCQIQI